MKLLQGKLTYANVMATIAVFIAIGGGAYAATELPKNSVGPQQLRKAAVTPAKLSAGAKATLTGPKGERGEPGAPGAPGSPGAPGAAATALWAEVSADGELLKTGEAVAAKKEDVGYYVVTFKRDVSACSYQATMGFSPGAILAELGKNDAHAVTVETFNLSGPNQDFRFHLAVFC